MGRNITRKDFLNTSLLGVGGALLGAAAPAAALEAARPSRGAGRNGAGCVDRLRGRR
jgi:hypothetical protein